MVRSFWQEGDETINLFCLVNYQSVYSASIEGRSVLVIRWADVLFCFWKPALYIPIVAGHILKHICVERRVVNKSLMIDQDS